MATDRNLSKASLMPLDYVLFIGSLAVSAAVGIYYAWRGGKNQTTKEVLFGNKELGILPVAMSLVATYMSAISLLGCPAEFYQFGTMFYYYALMHWIALPLAAYVFLPVFYNLQLTSAYEYLELRFDHKVRLTASIIFCLQVVLYLSAVLYAPALALSSVTDISMVASVLTTGLVGAFYTCIGGAKAVVWNNVWQVPLIIAGLLAVIIGGMIQLGGMENVWAVAENGGRINFSDFRLDPRVRHSFWSLSIGGTFMLLTLFSGNQMTVQRYISMKSLKSAQIALIINAPLNFLVITLYALAGLVMYATYSDCDPKELGLVSKSDQILPYFIIDKLSHLHGLPGLFVSSIYGAGLSTLAAGFNALAAVVLEDFVKPFYYWKTKRTFEDETGALITKFVALGFGLGTIGLAFMYSLLKSTVLQIALSIFGIGCGPILGVFCLGMFTPWPNAKGALAGLLISVAFTLWVGLGPIVYGLNPTPLPVSTENCWAINFSSLAIFENVTLLAATTNNANITSTAENVDIASGLMEFYKLSYQYYSVVGVIVVLLVGTAVSAVTGFNRSDSVDHKLIIPMHKKLCCCLGEKYSNRFKLGAYPEDYVDLEKYYKQSSRTTTDKNTNDTLESSTKESLIDKT